MIHCSERRCAGPFGVWGCDSRRAPALGSRSEWGAALNKRCACKVVGCVSLITYYYIYIYIALVGRVSSPPSLEGTCLKDPRTSCLLRASGVWCLSRALLPEE
jgi:hypothetical protein